MRDCYMIRAFGRIGSCWESCYFLCTYIFASIWADLGGGVGVE